MIDTQSSSNTNTGSCSDEPVSNTDAGHIPVLPSELLQVLDPQTGETYVDLTVGRGGHAALIAEKIGSAGRIIAFDLDEANLKFAHNRIKHTKIASDVKSGDQFVTRWGGEWIGSHANFVDAFAYLRSNRVLPNMILADLGFASNQMDDSDRGFSFSANGPLDMRLDKSSAITAADIVNESSERELADIIFHLGEDPYSRKIASAIIAERNDAPITTTARLANVVRAAYGQRARSSRNHPATRVFMALRLAVNNELGNLESLLRSITAEIESLTIQKSDRQVQRRGLQGTSKTESDEESPLNSVVCSGTRIALISFHSLEDRLVKRAMKDLARRGLVKLLTRKPLIASSDEVSQNPRARSAKLRALEVI